MAIHVEDSGSGIDKTRLQQLFAPLGNVEDFMTRGAGGAQLGLALANKLVADLNGKLEVRREVGKGTRITIGVPRFVDQPAETSTSVELF